MLSDRPFQGPEWTTLPIEVLYRFCVDEVDISADMRGMLFQPKVPDIERNELRRLSVAEIDVDEPVMECRMKSHSIGAVLSYFA